MSKRLPRETPDPVDVFVGGRIRERRVGLHISQTTLGEAIQVTFQQIQKYENGTNRVGASNLYKIACALDVGVGFFFSGMEAYLADRPRIEGFGEQPAAAFARDPMASKEAIELVYNFFRIQDDEVQKRVLDLVRSLPLPELEEAQTTTPRKKRPGRKPN